MISRKTAKKLASLTAVGAGALVLTAEKAEAGIIYQSFPPNTTVGFGTGNAANVSATVLITSTGAGHRYFGFNLFGELGVNSKSGGQVVIGSADLRFATGLVSGTHALRLFGAGRTWKSAFSHNATLAAASNFKVAGRFWKTGSTYILGNGAFSDMYALFTFQPADSAVPLYGWLELSESVTLAPGFGGDGNNPDGNYGPNVTIEAYAFDNSGNTLPAGESPEPASLSLAALALGAAGLRRWRSARKHKAA